LLAALSMLSCSARHAGKRRGTGAARGRGWEGFRRCKTHRFERSSTFAHRRRPSSSSVSTGLVALSRRAVDTSCASSGAVAARSTWLRSPTRCLFPATMVSSGMVVARAGTGPSPRRARPAQGRGWLLQGWRAEGLIGTRGRRAAAHAPSFCAVREHPGRAPGPKGIVEVDRAVCRGVRPR
jgi:hypothetical protein